MKKIFFFLLFLAIFKGVGLAIQNHPTSLVIQRIENTPLSYPIRFVVLGDSRRSFYGGPNADSIFRLARIKINQLAPLFVIHTGDFLQDGFRYEYPHFIAMIDSFETNFLTVRGNHELYADEGPFMYDSVFGPADYYFDYGIYRFIVLADCQQDPELNEYGYHYIDYLVSNSQLIWLQSLLEDARTKGLIPFVFAHVPPYQPGHDTTYCLGYHGYRPYPNYQLSHTQEFTNLLAQYNVPVAFFGHHHFYDRHEYQGVWYIITGGAGAPLYPAISPAPYGCSCYHFLYIELDSTGIMHAYFYKIGHENPIGFFNFDLNLSAVQENLSFQEIAQEQNRTIILHYGHRFRGSGKIKIFSIDGKRMGELAKGERIKLKAGVYLGLLNRNLIKIVVLK